MITQILGTMNYLLEQYQLILFPLGILVSLAQCFLGYRFLKGWVALLGFFAGLGGGYIISMHYLAGSAYAPLMIGILAGIILTLLSFMLFKAGVFALCAVIVGEMVGNLPIMERLNTAYLPGELGMKLGEVLPIVIVLICALTAGFLAMKFTRIIVILATAVTGAFRAVMYLTALLGVIFTQETRYVWFGVIGLLALLGAVVQNFTTDKD